MSERMLKTKEVAELLQIAPATVHKWVKKHDIKCSTNDRGHFYTEKRPFLNSKLLKRNGMTAGKMTPNLTYLK
ncbi:helix-turn-helix domain-containing protein [Thalassobacillus sp. C254]|uniref:helix-turn-helix domain-containing protein n=1 Tax=Thalassobacillus sp. C254 TaxID=1225341 RepID=UPI0006D1C5C9|nr:helix-turn-helix domain-containing protein [Thalassobacillus sp. C254]